MQEYRTERECSRSSNSLSRAVGELHSDPFLLGGLGLHISSKHSCWLRGLIIPLQSVICQQHRRSHLSSVSTWWDWGFLQMSDLQSQMETATQHCFEHPGLLAFPVLPHQLLTPGVPQHPSLEAVLNSSLDLPLTARLENCPSLSVDCNYTCKLCVWQNTHMPLSHSTIKKPKVKKLYWFLALTPTQVLCGRSYWRSTSSRKYFVPETHPA